jgi:hypothetical protein
MDLESFLTRLYVLVDDCYKQHIVKHRTEKRGRKPELSDSEVLTLSIAAQWRVGVPWQSERGFVRYMLAHGKGMFPNMLERSAFNRRARYLWGALVRLQQVIAELLETPQSIYECVDCHPLPAFTSGQANKEKGHWLWESTVGHGGNRGGFYWGDCLLMCVSSRGVITGWIVAAAHVQDRWLMEAFVSSRAGQPGLIGPPKRPTTSYKQHIHPPAGHIGPHQAAGRSKQQPYLADKGFNGQRWAAHWLHSFKAQVISVPPDNGPAPWPPIAKTWLASKRQIIETAFALLDDVFGLSRLNAHSRWGQYARLAAKFAAFNLACYLNHLLARPLFALPTLLC